MPGDFGTMNIMIRMPTSAAGGEKQSDRPKARVNNGPTTMASERQADSHADHRHGFGAALPSRVRSESRAITAAEIAPAPLQDASGNHAPDQSAWAASTLPRAKTTSPEENHRTPADAVGNDPERNLEIAWVRP